jgi:hypothetical protein
MKDLKFICAQPDDNYYIWQVHMWLESLKMLGHSDKAIVLVFTPDFREKNEGWQKVADLYPEAEFFYVKDEDKVSQMLKVYIPILRPYSLMKYFQAKPEMVNKAVFYCDSDVVFTENFNVDAYLEDDVCYLSDTNSYISASYFDSKVKDVLPKKLEEYKTRDVLAEVTSMIGITREICERNNENSGGAQYLLRNINKEYFENESKGYQSWCADMWAVLWNLWLREQETKNIPEMEFAWSSDNISKLERVGILHNAGIVGDSQGDIPTFYKGKYHQGDSPFKDPHIYEVLDSDKSKTLCNHYYLTRLFDIKQKYNLNY